MKTKNLPFLLFAFILMLFVASCEKDQIDDNNNNNNNNNQPDPVAVERQRVLNEYNNFYVASATTSTSTAWSGNSTACTPGTIAQDAIDKALIRINYFRRCVGLNDDITFDPVKNGKCQQGALMLHANNTLSHTPPTSWSCWTQEGSDACGSSNIAMGYSISGAITAYINDVGASNYKVGHRRWILYSRAKTMGIGHTTTFNALWVLGNGSNPVPENLPAFIPWPPKGFVPAPLVFDRWSFSKRLADFANADVTMKDNAGNPISLNIISKTDNGYGDNTIVWEPQNINKTSTSDVFYDVTVSSVKVNNVDSTYTYRVTIIQP